MQREPEHDADEIEDEDERIEIDPFAPEPETKAEAEEPEPKKDEPEAKADEDEPAKAEAEAEEPEAKAGEGDGEDERPTQQRETEHERGLRKQLEKYRRETREWEERWAQLEKLKNLQGLQPQTPPAAPAPEQQQSQAGPDGFRVQFDDDGNAYVPRDELARFVTQQTQPDPRTVEQERRAQAYTQLRQEFIGNDESRATLMQRAEQAHDEAERIVQSFAMRRGIPIAQVAQGGPDAIARLFRESGALEDVSAQYPDLGPDVLEDIIYASALGSAPLMKKALTRYAAAATEHADSETPATPRPKLREVPDDKPRSMARRGGSEPRGESSKEARLKHLTDRMAKDFTSLTEEEYAELEQLEKELDAA